MVCPTGCLRVLQRGSTAVYPIMSTHLNASQDHVVYRSYKGVVLDEEEGIAISEALGNKKAAILQNHGLLVASNSIEATVHFYIALEKCCQVQLLADAAGTTYKIDDADAAHTYKTVGTLSGGWFSGRCQILLMESQENLRFDFSKSYAPEQ